MLNPDTCTAYYIAQQGPNSDKSKVIETYAVLRVSPLSPEVQDRTKITQAQPTGYHAFTSLKAGDRT